MLRRDKYIWYGGSLLALWACFFVFYLLPFRHGSDMDYQSYVMPFINGGGLRSLFDGWWQSCLLHYNIDNVRIPNMLAPGLMLLPKWLNAAVLATAVSAVVYYGSRVAGVWRRSMFAFAVILCGVVFALPWYDNMFILTFGYNYVLPSALLLWLVSMYLGRADKSLPAFFVISLITSLFHELCATALVGIVLGACLVDRRYRSKLSLAVLLGATVGLAILASCPGTRYRGGEYAADVSNLWCLWRRAELYFPFYIFLIWTALRAVTRRGRVIFRNAAFVAVLMAACATYVPGRLYLGTLRSSWICLLLSIIGIAMLLPRRCAWRRGWRVCAKVLLVLAVLHCVLCVPWFVKFRNMAFHDIELGHTQTGMFYTDIPHSSDSPWYLLGKPSADSFGMWGYPVAAHPRELATFGPDNCGRLVGDSVYLYHRWVLVQCSEPVQDYLVEINYGWHRERDRIVSRPRFVRGGRSYEWLAVSRTALGMRTDSVRSIHIQKIYK